MGVRRRPRSGVKFEACPQGGRASDSPPSRHASLRARYAFRRRAFFVPYAFMGTGSNPVPISLKREEKHRAEPPDARGAVEGDGAGARAGHQPLSPGGRADLPGKDRQDPLSRAASGDGRRRPPAAPAPLGPKLLAAGGGALARAVRARGLRLRARSGSLLRLLRLVDALPQGLHEVDDRRLRLHWLRPLDLLTCKLRLQHLVEAAPVVALQR